MIQSANTYLSLFKKQVWMLLVVVFVGQFAVGQDTLQLRKQINQLHSALLNKQIDVLQPLLHPSLSYGHSNGWVQSTADMSADLISGKIVYKKLDATPGQIAYKKILLRFVAKMM